MSCHATLVNICVYASIDDRHKTMMNMTTRTLTTVMVIMVIFDCDHDDNDNDNDNDVGDDYGYDYDDDDGDDCHTNGDETAADHSDHSGQEEFPPSPNPEDEQTMGALARMDDSQLHESEMMVVHQLIWRFP